MSKTINVFLTTVGRETLPRMLGSLVNQLGYDDFLTIASDAKHDFVRACITNFDWKCPVIHIQNPEPLGWWGHGSRNKYQNSLPGDYIMNGDDDDRYVDGAFNVIRNTIGENKLYLFRHQDKFNFAWWHKNKVEEGNVGTSCGVIPNNKNLPTWEHVYGGDGKFYEKLSHQLEVVWCDHVIYKVRDTQ